MDTITKKALVECIAEKTGLKRTVVKTVMQEFLDEVMRELAAGNRLEFRDFGVFEVKERAARVAQNPRTLEPVPVPARRSVKFKVGRKMQDMVEGLTSAAIEDEEDAPAARGVPAQPTAGRGKPVGSVELKLTGHAREAQHHEPEHRPGAASPGRARPSSAVAAEA
jgi:integration host factor subunit beta